MPLDPRRQQPVNGIGIYARIGGYGHAQPLAGSQGDERAAASGGTQHEMARYPMRDIAVVKQRTNRGAAIGRRRTHRLQRRWIECLENGCRRAQRPIVPLAGIGRELQRAQLAPDILCVPSAGLFRHDAGSLRARAAFKR